MVVAQIKGSDGDREKGSDLGYLFKVVFFSRIADRFSLDVRERNKDGSEFSGLSNFGRLVVPL